MKTAAWKQIEKDFIKWDNATHSNASQRQILDWFEKRFKAEPLPMKPTRSYNKGCDYCACTGWVRNPDFDGMTSKTTTTICPVCNGAKVITVTEVVTQSVPEISDEEINNVFPLIDNNDCDAIERINIGTINRKRESKREGAKWYKYELARRMNNEVASHNLQNDDNALDKRK